MILRPVRPEDADAIAAIYAPHVTHGIATFETEPPDAAAMRLRIAAAGALYPWLVAVEAGDDRVAGYAYAGRFRERAAYAHVVETSIYVAAGAQRQGVGNRLYRALLATLEAQGFTQAIGALALPNPASVRLHEAVGFRRAGLFPAIGHKCGGWIDVGYWQRPLAAATEPPPAILPFAETGIVPG